MRIVVLGDYHIRDDELDLTRRAMEDVARLQPDLVVALGDFGTDGTIGSPAGLEKSYELLLATGARVRPILGNHDLQRESGRGEQRKHTMARVLKRLYRLERIYDIEEYDDFRIFYLCCEPQPARSCYQVQECYISQKQFKWFAAKLKERPRTPALVFSHAPPIGSGLRTVPDVHVRSTNAYLDQNHDPRRWSDLIRGHPGYLLWFSGHYHLGHAGPGAAVEWERGCFFTTAVHGSVTRDGQRASRVIEASGRGFRVSTLDHVARGVHRMPDWECSMETETEAAATAVVSCERGWRKTAATNIGLPDERPSRIALMKDGLAYVGTSAGYLWEACPADRAVLGTLQLGSPVDDVAATEKTVWWCADGRIHAAQRDDPWRFARLRSANPEPRRIADAPPGRPVLAAAGARGAWAAGEGGLLRLDRRGIAEAYELPARIGSPKAIAALGPGSLELLNDAGELWRIAPKRGKHQLVSDGWLAWHRTSSSAAAGIRASGIVWFADGAELELPFGVFLPGGKLTEDETAHCEIVCGDGGAATVRLAGRVYGFVRPAARPALICADGAAMLAAGPAGRKMPSFGIYKSASHPSEQPLLEIWTMEEFQTKEAER